MLPIKIRPMRIEDLAEVMEIDQLSFSNPWPISAYKYELTQNRSSVLWVAELNLPERAFSVVGMIVAWLVHGEAHIATLAVHPEFRKEGIAKQLLVYTLGDAVHRGIQEAMLEVRESNQAAQNLYRQFGFEIVGRRPRYYKDNLEDALLMNLTGLSQIDFDRYLVGVKE